MEQGFPLLPGEFPRCARAEAPVLFPQTFLHGKRGLPGLLQGLRDQPVLRIDRAPVPFGILNVTVRARKAQLPLPMLSGTIRFHLCLRLQRQRGRFRRQSVHHRFVHKAFQRRRTQRLALIPAKIAQTSAAVAQVITAAVTICDRHPLTALPAAKQAGQQSAPPSACRPAVARQYMLVEFEILPGDVGREAVPDQNPPAVLNRAVATQIALPPPSERPGIDRIGQDVVNRAAARGDPGQPAPPRTGDPAQRKPLAICGQRSHRGAHAAKATKRIEHTPDACLHASVRIQHHCAGAVAHIAARNRQLQLAPLRLRFTASMHPLTHGMQLRLRNRGLGPQQEPVIRQLQVVEGFGIGDQRIRVATQLEKTTPLREVTREARHLTADDDPHMTEKNLADQARKSPRGCQPGAPNSRDRHRSRECSHRPSRVAQRGS